MQGLGQSLHIVDRAQDVAGMGASCKDSLVRYQRSKVLRRQLGIRVVRIRGRWQRDPPFDGKLLMLCKGNPGGKIRFMVELREYDLGARWERKREGEVTKELSGGAAQD